MKAYTYPAFLMEGLHDAGYTAVIDAYGQGCIELVQELVAYTPYIKTLVKAVEAVTPDHPGVFEYEVCSPFGRWFGQHILESGAPNQPACRAWLAAEVVTFFSQYSTPAETEKIMFAVTQAVISYSETNLKG